MSIPERRGRFCREWFMTPVPSPKRRRVEPIPEPDYINLVSDDDEEGRQDGKQSWFFDLGPKQRSASRNERNVAQPSRSRAPMAGPSQENTQPAGRAPAETEMQRKTRIETEAKRLATAEVDSAMPRYLQGVPEKVYGKKKAKKGKTNNYYVVWSGRNCGIFTDWATCEAQIKKWPNQGYQGEEHYEDAKYLLREKLIERLTKGKMQELIDKDSQLHRSQPHTEFSDDQSHYQQLSHQQHIRASDNGVSAHADAEESGGEDFIPVEDFEVSREPPLCQEQQDAMNLAMEGHNLFITGSGGCGKSVLVRALYDRFRAMGKGVYLVAPTGQAALNIGGRTTFSYAGWTPDDMKKPLKDVLPRAHGKQVWKRLSGTQVLIIDEISMVENLFFERLSLFMCEARQDSRPWGGVQVIVVGDFCQLPPALPFEHCTSCSMALRRYGGVYYCGQRTCELFGHKFIDEDKWAFRSPEWNRCNFKYVHLAKIHRQQDEQFVGVLQKCRLGKGLGRDEADLLLNHDCDVENGVKLFSHRREVDACNSREFNQLPGKPYQFWCLDTFSAQYGDDSEYLTSYTYFDDSADASHTPHFQRPLNKLKDHRFSKLAAFKINMPVILLSNIDLKAGLCNGSQGIVCGFVPRNELAEPKHPNEDNYKDNPAGYRAAAQRYHQITKFLASHATPREFPLVRFANGQTRAIGPDCTVSEIGAKHPYSLLSRTQIPLAPGWAMTIHKSQSLSLERVIVDLGAAWEKGQAYVAVSRARSLRGLKVLGLTAATVNSKFELDPMVRSFTERLEVRRNDLEYMRKLREVRRKHIEYFELEAKRKLGSARDSQQRVSGGMARPGPSLGSHSESGPGDESEYGYFDEDLCQGEDPRPPEGWRGQSEYL